MAQRVVIKEGRVADCVVAISLTIEQGGTVKNAVVYDDVEVRHDGTLNAAMIPETIGLKVSGTFTTRSVVTVPELDDAANAAVQ